LTTSTTSLIRTIVYTYDNLYRLVEADYSTHSTGSGQADEAFAYAYDELGNQTAITESRSTGSGPALDSTVVTTYTYNTINQLTTARADSDNITWHYRHDDNGNLLRQVPGGTTPAEGKTRYSYDGANRLVEVELYLSGSYTLLSEAEYNGDGQRVALTTYALGVGQTISYV
ncbi:MAG: hypothetical protein GY797_13460, partial [Deltaproteobacteria bacterium]|nr:hypothetical protein [Deltaproteobacteria bacterium]